MAIPENPEVWVTVSGANGPINVAVDAPHLYELEINRIAGDMANSFKLQVLDSVANTLEYNLLSSSGGNIWVRYRGTNVAETGSTHPEYKEFNGYITKMSTQWYNDRNMLTLEGILGINLENKYQKISFTWNKVPKFNWENVFSDYVASGLSRDANTEDDDWEEMRETLSIFTGSTSYAWSALWNGLKESISSIWDSTSRDETQFYWDDYDYSLSSKTPYKISGVLNFGQMYDEKSDFSEITKYMKDLAHKLRQDASGKFYFPKMQFSKNLDVTLRSLGWSGKEAEEVAANKSYYVKQSGDFIVPMRPSSIIKLICEGGNYTDLIAKDQEEFDTMYKGFEMYNGDATWSELDWIWIQVWYEMMGKFDGIGLDASDIEETDLVEEDMSQTSSSFTDYIVNDLMPVCKKSIKEVSDNNYKDVYTDNGGTLEQYFKTYTLVYTNYMFEVDGNNCAHLKRVSAKNIYNNAPVATYYYYGTPTADSMPHNKNSYGILQTFSASQDVLTSLITNGVDSSGDISNMDIVYGKKHKDTKTTVEPEKNNLIEFDGWGKVQVEYAGSSSTKTATSVSLAKVQEQAEILAYEADATILGTSNLKPMDLISINVVTKDTTNVGGAYKHHTSGNYLVQKISETITNDGIVSKLHLIKNANNLGVNQLGYTKYSAEDTVIKVRTEKGILRDVQEVERYYMDLDKRAYIIENNLESKYNTDPPDIPSAEAFEAYNNATDEYREKAYAALVKEDYGYDPSISCPASPEAYYHGVPPTYKDVRIFTPHEITAEELENLEKVNSQTSVKKK